MAPVCMGKLAYFHIQSQWTDFIGSFFTPILTLFAVISIVLNSMQVELAAEGLAPAVQWPQFVGICRWVAGGVIVLVLSIMGVISGFFCFVLIKELVFARQFIRAKKSGATKELQAMVTGTPSPES